MSIAKVTEIISSSSIGIEDAVHRGISRASDTLDDITGVWVKDIKATVKDGKIDEWRVNLALTFVLKD